MEKQQADGAIWQKPTGMSLKLGDDNYKLEKVTDKKNDKYPDWKCENAAAWEKVSSKGNDYLFMKINETDYVAFKNGFKNDDKQPDWRVFKSKPKE